MLHKNEILPLFITLILLLLIAFLGTLATPTSLKSMLSLAGAIFLYIILPGYCILLSFNLTPLERIIFGTPISVSVVSITLYTFDIIGIPLSTTTTLVTIFSICALGLVIRWGILRHS